ncbi:MAG: YeiH family protein [Clostridiaceae bacterium]|nr:YeiH family protein [Clostridiaceae bacterium]
MNFLKKNWMGMGFCLILAFAAYFLGKQFPIIGGPVFGILIGMAITLILKDKSKLESGIKFTSKKILQYAVVLLGFGLNLNVILKTGAQSLPIIISTITVSLLLAYLVSKAIHIPGRISTLVGVGSSICGGSAIAATAPVIKADDEEVAQAISVIFFYNVLAALLFPHFGSLIGFSHSGGEAFGIFAGTAVNDTSSVTACAATWDNMWNLGSATLDKAVTVKLTRTLAIIPITLVLSFMQAKKENKTGSSFRFSKVFPFFILFFLGASVITTAATSFGVSAAFFAPFKELSKFFIIWAMAAIGLNTNIIKLVKTGGKPLLLGFICWCGITAVSLGMQHVLGIW